MTFSDFTNKLKDFVLSVEQKRRLYIAIHRIVNDIMKEGGNINVPQDMTIHIFDDVDYNNNADSIDDIKAMLNPLIRNSKYQSNYINGIIDALIRANIFRKVQSPA